MMSKIHLILCGAAFAIATSVTAVAQAEAPEKAATEQSAEDNPMIKLMKSIDWKSGTDGSLGNLATLKVPEDYLFTGTAGTVKLMEAYGNLTNGSELGYISPKDMSWFAVFEFDDIGYVKDDEKDNLNADKILEQLKEGQQQANVELSKRGMPTLQVLGWQTPPFYNPATHNLEWAIRLHSSDGDVVNYKTKILGRRGVMDVVLVCGEEELPVVIEAYQKVLTGFSYKKEESYASFVSGDKIAKGGLTALIVGGGLLVAAKSGLLGKLIKPIIAGVLIVGAFLKRIFVGKTKESI